MSLAATLGQLAASKPEANYQNNGLEKDAGPKLQALGAGLNWLGRAAKPTTAKGWAGAGLGTAGGLWGAGDAIRTYANPAGASEWIDKTYHQGRSGSMKPLPGQPAAGHGRFLGTMAAALRPAASFGAMTGLLGPAAKRPGRFKATGPAVPGKGPAMQRPGTYTNDQMTWQSQANMQQKQKARLAEAKARQEAEAKEQARREGVSENYGGDLDLLRQDLIRQGLNPDAVPGMPAGELKTEGGDLTTGAFQPAGDAEPAKPAKKKTPRDSAEIRRLRVLLELAGDDPDARQAVWKNFFSDSGNNNASRPDDSYRQLRHARDVWSPY
jgi:hypothetical protein